MPLEKRAVQKGVLETLLKGREEIVARTKIHNKKIKGWLDETKGVVQRGGGVHLTYFAAWMYRATQDGTTATKVGRPRRSYEETKIAASKKKKELAREGRDIGKIPDVVNPERKAACEFDLKLYCETYHADTFYLGWSDDHLKVIKKLQTSIIKGGLFALAMPRGSGKSTMTIAAAKWATLYGHRKFVVIIGAENESAKELLESIKVEIESNELLMEDFPEVAHPVRSLDGINHRAKGQLHRGERTRIEWSSDSIVMPTIKGSPASGACIQTTGITGRVRGMQRKLQGGETIRPDFALIDDPQTDETARSPNQCRVRERLVAGAVLGLAGPGKKITGVMLCTVVQPADMADNILDPEKHPEWNPERMKLLYKFPDAEDTLWKQYAEIWKENLQETGSFEDATAFYAANREAMDKGAIVAWDERHDPDEISGLQFAMNLKLKDRAAFYAEYQNTPLEENLFGNMQVSAKFIRNKLSMIPWDVSPVGTQLLVSYIDIQAESLWWVSCAFQPGFTGGPISYNTFPKQKRLYYTRKEVMPNLSQRYPGMGYEARVYAALKEITEYLFTKEWDVDGGSMLRMNRVMIDANFGDSTETVYKFCRESEFGALLLPSHGQGITPNMRAMNDYKTSRGDIVGENWRIPADDNGRKVRHIIYDTNWWKTFWHNRLTVPIGDSGCMTLPGSDPERHEMISHHWHAEYFTETTGRGRTVNVWRERPERTDNDLMDAGVGCCVCASTLGMSLFEGDGVTADLEKKKTPRISLVEKREMLRQQKARG